MMFRQNVTDLLHKVIAVGSRDIPTAQKFIDAICSGDKTIKAYGTTKKCTMTPPSTPYTLAPLTQITI
ncbi:hypothetical protein DL96DRAFT_647108 [Flagelloscypha sp. PMI_526]|nr:hypothetical protein DL96DRAFT_647108 [Flagelloscypha sp. PMI_526]